MHELLAPRAQMIELKYQDKVLPKPTKDMEPFRDSHLYLGTSDMRRSVTVYLALEKYVRD